MLPIFQWAWVHPLKHESLASAHTLKKSSDSPTSRSHQLKSSLARVRACGPSPLIAGMWIGLILCIFFVGRELLWVHECGGLVMPKDTILDQSCLTYGSKNLSAPSSAMVPEPWSGRVWYRCSICGWTLHKQLLSAFWAGVRIFINHFPLYKETSLMRLEGNSNLQLLEIGI